MKIHEIFKSEPMYQGPVMGLEIEVEGDRIPDKDALSLIKEWKLVQDGSLRGECGEYILRKPLSPALVKKSIINLNDLFIQCKSKLDFSERTSVHVHLNVFDMEFQHLANLIYIYYILEEILLQYCGNGRHDNRFCLSVRRAEGIISEIQARLNPRSIGSFSEERCKYAALNLAAIPMKGSIEFRGMRGTSEIATLFPWLDVIQNLYTVAKSFNNPKEISQRIINQGISPLLKSVFKEHLEVFKIPNMEGEVQYNMSLCAELPEYLTEKQAVVQKEDARIRMKIKQDINWGVPNIIINGRVPPIHDLDLRGFRPLADDFMDGDA